MRYFQIVRSILLIRGHHREGYAIYAESITGRQFLVAGACRCDQIEKVLKGLRVVRTAIYSNRVHFHSFKHVDQSPDVICVRMAGDHEVDMTHLVRLQKSQRTGLLFAPVNQDCFASRRHQ